MCKIKIVGIGDHGISAIRDLGGKFSNVECFDLNSDWAYSTANKFIKIGKTTTGGLGAGALAMIGEKAAEEDGEEITKNLKGCSLLIMVAGLGGGTGSGASAVVGKIARELNIPSVAFVTMPPEIEGKIRCYNAQYGLKKLKEFAGGVVEIPIKNFKSETNLQDAFRAADKTIKDNILKLIELFNAKNKSLGEILKQFECDKNKIFINL